MKNSVRKSLKHIKKALNSNRYSRKAVRSTKRAILRLVQDGSQAEVYDVGSFYPTIQEYYKQQQDIKETDPLISILLPTYNTPEQYLRECIESITIQSYTKWELCIADDNSPNKNIVKIIREYQKRDGRIKLVERKTNGHISEATNSALGIAKGDFISLMDHDDVLWPNALYEMALAIRRDKKVDFLYSDEDKIDSTGKIHSYPFLKPDFSPEFLESCNYITHFSCIRKTLMDQVAGFRKGYEGAQDWDLFLRLSELTDKIIHIPKLLYSWRIHEASTASDTDAKPYVYEAQRKLLESHLDRIGKNGVVETGIIRQHRTIKYEIQPRSLLAVVVSVSGDDKPTELIKSLRKYDAGAPYELLFISEDVDLTNGIQEWKLPNVITYRILQSHPTNYKAILDATKATDFLFIEHEAKIISENWAKVAMADSQLEKAGVVYPVILEKTKAIVQSAGVGVGYGDRGYVDMLKGTSFEDPHYTRGLYAKSRRNVSAGNSAVFVVNRKTLEIMASKYHNLDFFEMNHELLMEGFRHIYTPYLQVSLEELQPLPHGTATDYDKYLNPNFNKTNGRMEVKR